MTAVRRSSGVVAAVVTGTVGVFAGEQLQLTVAITWSASVRVGRVPGRPERSV
jgi:hypothetical protein